MSRRMASLALMAALYGSVGIEKRKGYTANFERVNMKGLSAEQMGTANSIDDVLVISDLKKLELIEPCEPDVCDGFEGE